MRASLYGCISDRPCAFILFICPEVSMGHDQAYEYFFYPRFEHIASELFCAYEVYL